jgi:hypothetical protein
MRLFHAAVAPFLIGRLVLGCNTVSPDECWVNTSGGFGGGGTIPIGAGVGATSGDFPSPPPRRPLDFSDAPNPCIAAQSPCDEKCNTDYENAAIECSKNENDAQRKTCQDGAYGLYRSCHENCQQNNDRLERCKQECDRVNLDCIANCPRGDKNCMNECNQANGRCLKECDRKFK